MSRLWPFSGAKMLINYVAHISDADEINNDLDVLEKQYDSISFRSKVYSRIVKNYSLSLATSLKDKRIFKHFIFWTSLVILVCVTLVTFAALILLPLLQRDWLESVIALVPVMVSFLTVFIVIPKIITKYLFNPNEEKYMNQLIIKLQDYDITMKKNKMNIDDSSTTNE